MNIQDILVILAIALPLSLLLNSILDIKKIMNQITMIIFISIVTALLYNNMLKKKNMDSDKLFKKIFIAFIIITTIILVIKGFIHIYEKGGLKTANGLFVFLGMIFIVIAVIQIISINNTFNDLDELYKMMPNYLNNTNNKSTNSNNKSTNSNNKSTNNSNKANNSKNNKVNIVNK